MRHDFPFAPWDKRRTAGSAEPASAWRVHQDLGFESLAEGTVYPALSRMESKGLLTSRLVKSEPGPARKYYRPTNDGVAELTATSAAWEELVNNVNRVKQATTVKPETKS
ncbi:MAG: PadR family transcriptional regulator [Acidimicrobiales bacterium]